ncbi:phage holin [Rossellomorea vietnamensis]|uniref:phage holin n=1 Tax=Rossellomorea vietnamensis TaxID=218284 RepID=UPI00055679BB|nr:phage holin [Rossellomorea vietnamensis]
MINWKIRFLNKTFLLQVLGALFLPLLAYQGLAMEDLTTWSSVGELFLNAFTNPYLLAITAWSIFNAVTDPTVKGIGDSLQAKGYKVPKEK